MAFLWIVSCLALVSAAYGEKLLMLLTFTHDSLFGEQSDSNHCQLAKKRPLVVL